MYISRIHAYMYIYIYICSVYIYDMEPWALRTTASSPGRFFVKVRPWDDPVPADDAGGRAKLGSQGVAEPEGRSYGLARGSNVVLFWP